MHSCAKVFCSRFGERSGPVQNGDSTTRESMRSLLTVPVPPETPSTVPATYDGTTFWPLAERAGRRRRRRSRREGRRLEAGKIARHLVARLRVTGTSAADRRPRLVVPRDDVAVASRPTR